MTNYYRFTELVPENLTAKIPESRTHHALWNLSNLIKNGNPDLYDKATSKGASDDVKKEMTELISSKWDEIMAWHVKNGLISDPDHPKEIKRDPVETDPGANKKVLACVKQEYVKRIPFFIRKHATEKTCGLIAREFPDLYAAFKDEPTQDQKDQMTKLINAIFEERMAKHNM